MSRVPSFLAGAALALVIALPFTTTAGPQDPDGMAEMMKKAEKFTRPGANHAALARFVGSWDVTTHFCQGDEKSPGEPGSAEFSWLFEGRWLAQKSRGTMMKQPVEGFHLLGYDNFKQSYVIASVSTMDTALNVTEGDMDQWGKALITYGTIDEYLTGEDDKAVKTVWRFVSDDEMVHEIHDLAIGESNTKVIEMRYKRKPAK